MLNVSDIKIDDDMFNGLSMNRIMEYEQAKRKFRELCSITIDVLGVDIFVEEIKCNRHYREFAPIDNFDYPYCVLFRIYNDKSPSVSGNPMFIIIKNPFRYLISEVSRHGYNDIIKYFNERNVIYQSLFLYDIPLTDIKINITNRDIVEMIILLRLIEDVHAHDIAIVCNGKNTLYDMSDDKYRYNPISLALTRTLSILISANKLILTSMDGNGNTYNKVLHNPGDDYNGDTV